MYMKVITISAIVEIAGKTITSGSRLLLKEMNMTFVVIRVVSKPKDMVATITVRIAEKSANVIPQNSVPKSMAITLMVALVVRVRTTIAPMSL